MTRLTRDQAIDVFLKTSWMQNAFWARVRLKAGCWEWRGAWAQRGYGVYAVSKTLVLAHRLSYAYWYQRHPAERVVCHGCDNPQCTNPEHLFLGTQLDNIADRVAKGRSRGGAPTWQGEEVPGSKLTAAQVHDIRAAHAGGIGPTSLSHQYGVKPGTVSAIVARRTWSHL